jgi:transposase
MIFVGVDWAEARHDVHVQNEEGRRLAGGRLAEGVEGIAWFHELVGGHVDDPAEVVVGIETDRGLFVAGLTAAGYQVFAVNPMSTSRYRDRHSTSGAESDPGDAKVLADMVRTDRRNHRPVSADSEAVQAVKILARAHQSMIWSRGRQTNALRSTLREFYPAALAFDDLTSGDALEVLRVAPAPELGRGLSISKIAAALRRGGRQRRVDERASEIQTALGAPHLAAPAAISTAMGASVSASVAVIAAMVAQIAELARELEAGLSRTPTPRWSVSCQDWGPSSEPGCLESSATSRTGMGAPSLAKTMPAPRPSPEPRGPNGSCWPATPATSASPTPSTCGRSPRSAHHPELATSTTVDGPPETPTTPPYEHSEIDSSASSTAACDTTASTTKTSPGPTGPNRKSTKRLDTYSHGMSSSGPVLPSEVFLPSEVSFRQRVRRPSRPGRVRKNWITISRTVRARPARETLARIGSTCALWVFVTKGSVDGALGTRPLIGASGGVVDGATDVTGALVA